jgi:hypothetical protein
MSTNRKVIRAILFVCAALLIAVLVAVIRYRTALKPFGEGPRTGPSASGFAESSWGHFLDADFKIVTDVNKLPGPVQQALFEQEGGLRPFMANPKDKFLTGDVIGDVSLPRPRLIFAGVTDDKCFVHFEQGGRGLSYFVDFFGETPNGKMKFLGTDYCPGPAINVQDLGRCLATRM